MIRASSIAAWVDSSDEEGAVLAIAPRPDEEGAALALAPRPVHYDVRPEPPQPKKRQRGRSHMIVDGIHVFGTTYKKTGHTMQLSNFLRVVGSPVERDFALASQAQTAPGAMERDQKLAKLMKHCLGPTPRPSMPLVAEAKLLQVPRQTLPTKVCDIGAALFCASRCFATSFLSHILWAIELKVINPQMLLLLDSYDETAMQARCFDSHGRISFIGKHNAIMAGGETKEASKASRQLVKFLQCDCAVMVSYYMKESKQLVAIACPLLMPLAVCDSATGSVMYHVKQEWTRISLLSSLQHHFFNVDLTTTDRAIQISKAEHQFSLDAKWTPIKLKKHNTHTTTYLIERLLVPKRRF